MPLHKMTPTALLRYTQHYLSNIARSHSLKAYDLLTLFSHVTSPLSSYPHTGSTMVAVFGLPPLAHENDPSRGLLSSLKMQQEMSKLNVSISVGVTSGLAFCGLLGTANRREYTVLGDSVNLSARLMQAALHNNGGES